MTDKHPFHAGTGLSGEIEGEGRALVLLHGLTATRRNVVQGSRLLARAGLPPDRLRRPRPRRVRPGRALRVHGADRGPRGGAGRARPRPAGAGRKLHGSRDRDGVRARAPRARACARADHPRLHGRAPDRGTRRTGTPWPMRWTRGGIEAFVDRSGVERAARALSRRRPAGDAPADGAPSPPRRCRRRAARGPALGGVRRAGAALGARRADAGGREPRRVRPRASRSRSPRSTRGGCRAPGWWSRSQGRRRWPGRARSSPGRSRSSSAQE